MVLAANLRKFLEDNKVAIEILQHPVAYTASEIAGSKHIPGKLMIKSVLIKADGQYILCVLPATQLIDFEKLKRIINANQLELSTEEEIARIFPEYELGAEPPFGHLHGLKVYVDQTIEEDKEVVFNAGTHTDLIKIATKDFLQLGEPILCDFSRHI